MNHQISQEKISVIVPVYNSERFLEECLDSVLNQTYSNIEVVVVDDGSTDNSRKILKDYGKIDNRVKTVFQSNQGVSAARNRGLQVATGEYITFLDSDDTIDKNMYMFLMGVLRHYRADIAHCGYKRLDENGKILKEVSGTSKILVQKPDEAIQCILKGRYFTGGVWNKVFCRKVTEGLTFDQNIKFNEDVLFTISAFNRASKIVFADETKYNYIEHKTSACHATQTCKKNEHCVAAAEKIVNILQTSDAKDCALEKLLESKLYLLQEYSKSRLAYKNQIVELKNSIKAQVKKMRVISPKVKIKYYLQVHMSLIYNVAYEVYNRIRKPNWDVVEK